jgi:predicted metalloprotease with PDZ domain
VADEFVRVRLTRTDGVNLNLFEFDLDLTLMMFFLSAEDKIYARYGGRDGENADNRQSLAGLRYTMKSVLDMHRSETKAFAPRGPDDPALAARGKSRGCVHCHQIKERQYAALERNGQWDRSLVHRYPLPDNLGLFLEVDRGNVVKNVKPGSPADKAGLRKGDVVRELAGVPIHSFGDAQFALDRARKQTTLPITWNRADQTCVAKLDLPAGWQITDLHWRRSVRPWVPSLRLDGKDLTVDEKKALGLAPKQLAYRPRLELHPHVKRAGIQENDIIIGYNGHVLETDVAGFYELVCNHHLVGDNVTINVLRDGKRVDVPMTLIR